MGADFTGGVAGDDSGVPKKPGYKPTKSGEWRKKRTKMPWRKEESSASARLVGALLEDFSYGGAADFNSRPGGSSDPWRQGGFGPIPGLENVEGDQQCPACGGMSTDEVGEPCAHCEGTGRARGLEAGEDQLNTPGTDPTQDLEAGGATGATAPPASVPQKPPQPGPPGAGGHGNRMQWRPEESLSRRLLR